MIDVYAPGNRPRCGVCDDELEPAASSNDGQPCYRGFLPCPKHPRAKTRYPLVERAQAGERT